MCIYGQKVAKSNKWKLLGSDYLFKLLSCYVSVLPLCLNTAFVNFHVIDKPI